MLIGQAVVAAAAAAAAAAGRGKAQCNCEQVGASPRRCSEAKGAKVDATAAAAAAVMSRSANSTV